MATASTKTKKRILPRSTKRQSLKTALTATNKQYREALSRLAK
jgi:hypothetical protein